MIGDQSGFALVATHQSALQMNFGHRPSIGHSLARRALNSATRPLIGGHGV